MAESIETPSDDVVKKPWQPLEINVLDVPSVTKTGTGRIDPTEDFFNYRTS